MAVAAPDEVAKEDAALTTMLHKELARAFVLPKDLKLDPALREEADEISAGHLARIKQLIPVWLQDERRLQTSSREKTGAGAVYQAVWARLLNELAFWQIEPGDAAYEKATLEVLKTAPMVCRIYGDTRFQDFASRVTRLQAMPPEERQAALKTERQLLERWGKPHAAAQPWPNPLPQDAAVSAIATLRDGGARLPVALPPVLASSVLAKRDSYADLSWGGKCALQRWYLGVSLAQGATPAAALNAFRYGTLITATDRYGRTFESDDQQAPNQKSGAEPTYPKLAMRFDVTGKTQLSRQFDAAGKAVQASVIDRKITVRGIRDTRPIAFENTFDVLAVHYALQPGDSINPGKPVPKVFEMVWTLDSPPAATKSDSQSRGDTP